MSYVGKPVGQMANGKPFTDVSISRDMGLLTVDEILGAIPDLDLHIVEVF